MQTETCSALQASSLLRSSADALAFHSLDDWLMLNASSNRSEVSTASQPLVLLFFCSSLNAKSPLLPLPRLVLSQPRLGMFLRLRLAQRRQNASTLLLLSTSGLACSCSTPGSLD